MPQVSRNPLLNEVYEQIYSVFIKAVSKNRTNKEFANFLNELLTPTEKLMLSKRLMITYLLEQGMSYREIEDVIHVSTSTVNRVDINYRTSIQLKKIIKELVEEKNIQKMLTDIGIEISGLLAFSGSKTKTWKKLNESLKEKKEVKI